MYYNIPEDKKEKVIYDFIYTGKRIPKIAENNELSFAEVMWILEEYNKTKEANDGKRIRRGDFSQEELDEKIYNLRKQELSYKKISEEIGLGMEFVSKRCKVIYAVKGEKEPDCKTKKAKKIYIFTDTDEKIYDLRKQGISYIEIYRRLKKEKIKISYKTLIKKCKKIFIIKGEEEPETLDEYKKLQTKKSKRLDEKIYNLKEKGMSYKGIQEKLKKEGHDLSTDSIGKRYRRKFNCNAEQLSKLILNLMTTKKATLEQVEKIAEYYGVDLEKNLNSIEER